MPTEPIITRTRIPAPFEPSPVRTLPPAERLLSTRRDATIHRNPVRLSTRRHPDWSPYGGRSAKTGPPLRLAEGLTASTLRSNNDPIALIQTSRAFTYLGVAPAPARRPTSTRTSRFSLLVGAPQGRQPDGAIAGRRRGTSRLSGIPGCRLTGFNHLARRWPPLGGTALAGRVCVTDLRRFRRQLEPVDAFAFCDGAVGWAAVGDGSVAPGTGCRGR